MLREKMKRLAAALALCGLCMGAHANTTVAEKTAETAAPSLPKPALEEQAAPTAPAAMPVPTPKWRIAVLLPLRSATLGGAAASVLAGIKAGFEREPQGVNLEVTETDGTPQDVLRAYREAAPRNHLVIGPLARSEAAALVQLDQNLRPTIVLSPADSESTVLPPHMLPVGLSIEDEGSQVASWVNNAYPGGKALVVSTGAAWQKRAAKSFAAQAEKLGVTSYTAEIPAADGYLNAESLAHLKKKIAAFEPALIFAALDTAQAIQLRAAVGTETPFFGTSQLNPRVLSDWKTLAPIEELEGARLVDMPWQLQPDHPAVMIYPKSVPEPDRRRSADFERLYALGIDAYRIALELLQGHQRFTVDGVTGKLSVVYGIDPPYFERTLQPAVYKDGAVLPLQAETRSTP